MTSERMQFQSEAKRLLELMTHSVYSSKEVFLRELVSNASDAIDKRRFLALTQPELAVADPAIELVVDKDARTLSISDPGIGMSREEVIKNLGTIAHSGTKTWKDSNPQASGAGDDKASLIGQFGVGFYSSFMVAHRVSVVTRKAGEAHATLWSSEGDGEFTVAETARPEIGTTVTLHLRDADEDAGLDDFADAHVIERTVKKHSDFVTFPIRLKAGDDARTLNSQRPLWARAASEVKDEDYTELYRRLTHQFDAPEKTISVKAEGTLEYQALLFIPKTLSPDFAYRDVKWGLQLYVRRVAILERCEALLPPYLRFVQGVVDAADLPLNVSRELLQSDRQLTAIRRNLAKKVFDFFAQTAEEDASRYANLWKQFGLLLKEGIVSDRDQRDRLTALLRFHSSHAPVVSIAANTSAADATADKQLTSLAEYVLRMPEGQDAIYFMAGESRSALAASPHKEALTAKGYEVLYLTDAIDELVLESIGEHAGKKFVSAQKGAASEPLVADESLQPLLARLKDKLKDRVAEVRATSRLTQSPACLVQNEHDLSAHLAKMLERTQGLSLGGQRILEVNPTHALTLRLKALVEQNDVRFDDYAELLFGQAQLAEGTVPADPAKLAKLICDLMVR